MKVESIIPSVLCKHKYQPEARGERDPGLGSRPLAARPASQHPAGARAQAAPRARGRRAASSGGGSGSAAETEAFPVGERSEAPRERLQCAPSRSGTPSRARRPSPYPGSRPRAELRLRPRPLSEPRALGPAAAAALCAPSPPRAARRGTAGGRVPPAEAAGCWERWGRVRWHLGGRDLPTLPAPGAAAAAFLLTRPFLPALLRRAMSFAGRRRQPRCSYCWAAGGLREETGWRKLKGGGLKNGGRELPGFGYLGGSEFVTPPSAPRCALPSAPAHECSGEAARGGSDVPRVEG